jgi:hypothetical protein
VAAGPAHSGRASKPDGGDVGRQTRLRVAPDHAAGAPGTGHQCDASAAERCVPGESPHASSGADSAASKCGVPAVHRICRSPATVWHSAPCGTAAMLGEHVTVCLLYSTHGSSVPSITAKQALVRRTVTVAACPIHHPLSPRFASCDSHPVCVVFHRKPASNFPPGSNIPSAISQHPIFTSRLEDCNAAAWHVNHPYIFTFSFHVAGLNVLGPCVLP